MLGGFNERALFAEDYLLSKRVSKLRFRIVRGRVVTTNRRFQKLGHWTMIRMFFRTMRHSWDDEYKVVPAQHTLHNRIAPNFSRETLDDRKFTLTSLRGKVVLLNCWASWRGPCRVEMPTFVDWQRKYGAQGLQIIEVSMDDEERGARNAYSMYSLDNPVVMGDAKLGESYGGVLGLPVTYLIDRHGIIRFRHTGVTDLHVMEMKTLLNKY